MSRSQQDEALLIFAGIEPDIAERIVGVTARVVNPDSWIEARTAIRLYWQPDYLRWLGEARSAWLTNVTTRYHRLLDAANESFEKSVKADITTSPWYTYDERLGVYRNQVTGRFVAFRNIYILLDRIGTGHIDTLMRLCQQMHTGQMTATSWLLAMQNELVRVHVQSAALAAGGWNNLEPRDFRRIDQAIRVELDHLEAFGRDIRTGRIVSEAMLRNRLRMYLGTARTQFHQQYRPPSLQPNERLIERRELGEADHCELCIYLEMLGWQAHGTLPYPGQEVAWWEGDQCYSNCKCRLRREVVSVEEIERRVTSPVQRALR